MAKPITFMQILKFLIDQYTPSMCIILEEYEVDNVTVTVEWTQQVQAGDIASYNVIVSPQVPVINNGSNVFNGSTTVMLTLEYDLEYNLTIEIRVHSACESSATASITLYYGEIFKL